MARQHHHHASPPTPQQRRMHLPLQVSPPHASEWLRCYIPASIINEYRDIAFDREGHAASSLCSRASEACVPLRDYLAGCFRRCFVEDLRGARTIYHKSYDDPCAVPRDRHRDYDRGDGSRLTESDIDAGDRYFIGGLAVDASNVQFARMIEEAINAPGCVRWVQRRGQCLALMEVDPGHRDTILALHGRILMHANRCTVVDDAEELAAWIAARNDIMDLVQRAYGVERVRRGCSAVRVQAAEGAQHQQPDRPPSAHDDDSDDGAVLEARHGTSWQPFEHLKRFLSRFETSLVGVP